MASAFKRYRHLAQTCKDIHPQRIMEIGVYTGGNSGKMIDEAVKHRDDVEYWGFDFFEVIEGGKEEFIKTPWSIEKVTNRLNGRGAEIHLIKGDTMETLKDESIPKMDFIFIDGGHSQETIKSDWANVQRLMHDNTVVIFDDYWTGPALEPDSKYRDGGCKPLIDALTGYNIEFMSHTDKFPHLWTTFVKVTK